MHPTQHPVHQTNKKAPGLTFILQRLRPRPLQFSTRPTTATFSNNSPPLLRNLRWFILLSTCSKQHVLIQLHFTKPLPGLFESFLNWHFLGERFQQRPQRNGAKCFWRLSKWLLLWRCLGGPWGIVLLLQTWSTLPSCPSVLWTYHRTSCVAPLPSC